MFISVITPVYNEAPNIAEFSESLFGVLQRLGHRFEVIAVDDGSDDESLALLRQEAGRRPNLKVLSCRRNYGQTAAIMAAIDHVSGDVIIPIDADLQNDPADIPKMLEVFEQGFDVVSGWRKDRQDARFRRNALSRVANRIISAVSGVRLKDYGCTLKVYRREVLQGVRLYGEMHRFIPIYASWMGAKVTEVEVKHHPRKAGKSKYGLERIFKVFLDLLVVTFLHKYLMKPIYVFGGFGILSLASSAFGFVYMLYLKFVEGTSMIETPMPTLVAITFLVGITSILMGLLAEIMVRTYFESQNRTAYDIRERINFDETD